MTGAPGERRGHHADELPGGLPGEMTSDARGDGPGVTPAVPMPVFLDFLRRLHDGPPQHAAAVKVAIAVWQGAIARADSSGADVALEMVRGEVDGLIQSISALQEHGRRLAGQES